MHLDAFSNRGSLSEKCVCSMFDKSLYVCAKCLGGSNEIKSRFE